MSSGGGGDGGAAERKRQEDYRVNAAIERLNAIFGVNPENDPVQFSSNSLLGGQRSNGYRNKMHDAYKKRQELYSDIGDNAVNKASFDLNKDRETTERNNKFTLARQGVAGGSRDIDTEKEILDKYQQGLLEAANLGERTENNARIADEKTKTNLIGSIRSGLDEGSAQQLAFEGQRSNIKSAQDEANAASLAGFFTSLQPALEGYSYNRAYDQQLAEDAKRKQQQSVGLGGTANRYGGNVQNVG